MKKYLSLLMAGLLLSLALTACGTEDEPETDTSADTSAETETEPETEAETETETEPPETEPPMVEVFTPVYVENFDDASTANWKAAAQMSDFKIENGYLTTTATGGDSNIACKTKFELSCEEIDVIRVRYINNTSSPDFQIFYTSDGVEKYDEPSSFKAKADYTSSGVDAADAADSDQWNEIVIYTDTRSQWTGTLGTMRIDLSSAEGSYIIDSISFESVELVPAS